MANIIDSLKLGDIHGIIALPYGTCSTAAATAAKTVSLTNFVLETGASVRIKFSNANSASTPTLNVNSTGAKNIRWNNANLPSTQYWTANQVIDFVYDGSYWQMIGAAKDNNTNYYHTPSYTSTISTTQTGGSGSNIKIATGTGVSDMYIPVATATTPGATIVYPAANCTTFSSDSGTVTPSAVQKGAKMFAITRPTSSTTNNIVRFSNTTGDVKDSLIKIEDVTNTRDSSLKKQVIAIPAEGDKKMVYGYCTDQVDGTSFIGGVFPADATEYPYTSGLAIGGTSGNLLWKGKQVATTDMIPSVSGKMDKANPAGTGQFSMNRLSGSTVGLYSSTLGYNSAAMGASSHAEGDYATASGDYSHAEGSETVAIGEASHAEGFKSMAIGDYSHSEGNQTYAEGESSHAEGVSTLAVSIGAHAEGTNTIACGENSHAEGTGLSFNINITGAANAKSYVLDLNNSSEVDSGCVISYGGNYATILACDHTTLTIQVDKTLYEAALNSAQATCFKQVAAGEGAHVEGISNRATGACSHAEGSSTKASGACSHAEGMNTEAYSDNSHAEGYYTLAVQKASHAEGSETEAYGEASHAEGSETTASGKYSHAEGAVTTASGRDSHAEGYFTVASGHDSHAEGSFTTANSQSQHVQGEYNILDTKNLKGRGTYAHIVGNGTSESTRSNAHTLDWDGNAWFAGGVTAVGNLNVAGGSVYTVDSVLMGAAWNDYAEYRESDCQEAGRVICENGDDTLSLATERLQPGAEIISDTFGFAIGKTDKAQTPIAVSGRVLAYTYEDRNSYKPGDAVCAAPGGTVSKMTREEIREYPERIIGTVSAIPSYETWGTGNVPVNGRIWIKIK